MFDIKQQDIDQIIETIVTSKNPMKFSHIPAKEKKKYILVCMMLHAFEHNKIYQEKDVNEILKPMVEDYAMIRRYMVDYRLMERKKDGSQYWLSIDLKDFDMYRLTKD